MSIPVLRHPKRKSIRLQLDNKTNLLIPINLKSGKVAVDDHELDDLVRTSLGKKGYTEAQINAMIEKAEKNFEYFLKVEEAKKQLRQCREWKLKGNHLIQVGFRKWLPAFFQR